MIEIPVTRSRTLVVQAFKRTDEDVDPTTPRPWAALGPVVDPDPAGDRTIGFSVVTPGHAAAFYLYPRLRFT